MSSYVACRVNLNQTQSGLFKRLSTKSNSSLKNRFLFQVCINTILTCHVYVGRVIIPPPHTCHESASQWLQFVIFCGIVYIEVQIICASSSSFVRFLPLFMTVGFSPIWLFGTDTHSCIQMCPVNRVRLEHTENFRIPGVF